MTRYLICSAQRTGSNLLCDLLAQTGQAGIQDVRDGHFFLGTGEGLKVKTIADVDEWFATHATTLNGVQGCKGSFEYFDELHAHCGPELVEHLLNSFTHFVYLKREDIVAQAISWALAAQTKQFSSLSETPEQPAEYNYHLITYFMGRIEAQYKRFEVFFEQYDILPYVLKFEKWTQDFEVTLEWIFTYLDIFPIPDFSQIKPELKRQSDPRKQEWVDHYWEDCPCVVHQWNNNELNRTEY